MKPWFATATLMAVACNGALFTTEIRDQSLVTIETIDAVDQLTLDEFAGINLTESTSLQNQGVEPGDINNVTMTEFTMLAIDGDLDLAFLDSVNLYVQSDGLPKTLVASAEDFPQGIALISFDLEDVDLTAYVVSESMDFTTEVIGNHPNQTTRIEAEYAIDVGVTGQGACNNL